MRTLVRYGVFVKGKKKHEFNNIDIAHDIVYCLNQNIMAEPTNLLYNQETLSLCVTGSEFDSHPEQSKIVSDVANFLLKLNEKSGKQDNFVCKFFDFLKSYRNKENQKDFDLIFKDINLTCYFDEAENCLLKHKLNSFISNQKV